MKQTHPSDYSWASSLLRSPEKVNAANPETYIRPVAPPFLLQHGTKDPVVPVQQSIEFAEKLRPILGEENVTLELLEGAGTRI